MDLKSCSSCNQQWPNTLEYYHADYRQQDRLSKTCKECRKIIDSEKRSRFRNKLRRIKENAKEKGVGGD